MPISILDVSNVAPIGDYGNNDIFSNMLKMRESQKAAEDRGLQNEGKRHQNTILGAEAQYAPDKFKFANAIQEAKARYAAEQEQADVQQKLAHAAYFKNGGASGDNDATSPKERRRQLNMMGPDQKAELFRLGKANGWNPQETVDHWLKGTDFRKYAEEKGIDLDKDTTKYYSTSKNRTDLNTAVAAGAELDSLDDLVAQDIAIYGETFNGYSPEQIKDALSNKGEDQEKLIKFLGARAVQPEITALRAKIANGSNAQEALKQAQEDALTKFKIPGFTVSKEVRLGVQKYINSALKKGLEARIQSMVGTKQSKDKGDAFSNILKNGSSSGNVKVIFNGKSHTIPANQLQQALKAGGKLAEGE